MIIIVINEILQVHVMNAMVPYLKSYKQHFKLKISGCSIFVIVMLSLKSKYHHL